jgi:acetyl-CoA carboxylase carboxyltransferase component
MKLFEATDTFGDTVIVNRLYTGNFSVTLLGNFDAESDLVVILDKQQAIKLANAIYFADATNYNEIHVKLTWEKGSE